MSVSAVINPIFNIKATEDKNNIYAPMFFGSAKNVLSFDSLDAIASPKISDGGFGEWQVMLPHHIREKQTKRLL